MSPRRFLVPALLAPFFLGGCSTVSTVRTAFEMPVAPTPSPRELARARDTKAFDSLSKSVAKLNADTIRQILGTKASNGSATISPIWRPSPFAVQPASLLRADLNRGVNIPISPSPLAISLQGARPTDYTLLPPPGAATTLTIPSRRLYSSGLSPIGGGLNNSARDFLQAWASRASLRRSDEELQGRRMLEDRIDLQARSTLPGLNLSLVSPEIQLELTNLRLRLIPLLQVPKAQRAAARAQIEEIEARLNKIWEQETARQAAALRQTLVEIPARLRQEGEVVLAEQTRQAAAQDELRLAQVRRDLENRLRLPSVSAVTMAQNSATAPNSNAVRAQLGAPIGGARGDASGRAVVVNVGNSDIARRGANPPSRVPETVAAKNDRIWRQAMR